MAADQIEKRAYLFTGEEYQKCLLDIHQHSIGDPAVSYEAAMEAMKKALAMAAEVDRDRYSNKAHNLLGYYTWPDARGRKWIRPEDVNALKQYIEDLLAEGDAETAVEVEEDEHR